MYVCRFQVGSRSELAASARGVPRLFLGAPILIGEGIELGIPGLSNNGNSEPLRLLAEPE